MSEKLYTEDEMYAAVGRALLHLPQLDNLIPGYAVDDQKEEIDLTKRIKHRVVINDNVHWLSASTTQGLLDAYLELCIQEGVVCLPIVQNRQNGTKTPTVKEYCEVFVRTFKSNQASNTVVNRKRILRNHVYPKIGG